MNQLKENSRNLLTIEEGLKHRSKRPIEVEDVFGQLKSNNQFNRFTFKGLEKVEMEFLLMALGHNLRKMVAKRATSGKIVVKVAKQGSKIIFQIQIYFFSERKTEGETKLIYLINASHRKDCLFWTASFIQE